MVPGTVTVVNDIMVIGQGTQFTKDFPEGASIYIAALRESYRIAKIVSDTEIGELPAPLPAHSAPPPHAPLFCPATATPPRCRGSQHLLRLTIPRTVASPRSARGQGAAEHRNAVQHQG